MSRGVQARDELGGGEAARDARRSRRRARRDAPRAAGWSRTRSSAASSGSLEHVRAEPRPFARVLNGEEDVAPSCVVDGSVRRDRRVMRAAARRRGAAVGGVVAGALIHSASASNSETSMTAPRPVEARAQQRREDARVRVHAGRDVGDRDADLGWRVLGVPVSDSSPTSLCTSRSYALRSGVRPGRPVAGDRADDERGIARRADRRAPCRADRRRRARRSGRTRPRARAGASRTSARARLLQIERQRFLRSIEPDEVARQALDGRVVRAREVAAVRAARS